MSAGPLCGAHHFLIAVLVYAALWAQFEESTLLDDALELVVVNLPVSQVAAGCLDHVFSNGVVSIG